jgi:hypothetical protein
MPVRRDRELAARLGQDPSARWDDQARRHRMAGESTFSTSEHRGLVALERMLDAPAPSTGGRRSAPTDRAASDPGARVPVHAS